ncbi:MAG: hypothetical protein K2K24_05155, partial [Clostridia bacterium]|nr:hypothetical protein [Clostridia bacterium]
IEYTAGTEYGYEAVAILDDEWTEKYEISALTKAEKFKVGSDKKEVIVSMSTKAFTYDGQTHGKNDWTCIASGAHGTETFSKGNLTAKVYLKSDLGSEVTDVENAGVYVIKFSFTNPDFADSYDLVITEIEFEIFKAEISVTQSESEKEYKYDGTNREGVFTFASGDNTIDDGYVVKTYYRGNQVIDSKKLDKGQVPCDAGEYLIVLSVADAYKNNYKIKEEDEKQIITITKAQITATQTASEYEYDGENKVGDFTYATDNGADASNINIVKTYYKGDTQIEAPSGAGTYKIVLSVGGNDANNYDINEDTVEFTITIAPAQITAVWDTTEDIPVLKDLSEEDLAKIEYVFTDEDGITYKQSELEVGKIYKVKAVIKEDYEDNYVFVDKKGKVLDEPTATDEQTFKMKEAPKQDEPTVPVDPETPDDSEKPATSFDISKVVEVFKEYWQLIASVISIILMLIFITKTIGYE